MVERGKEIRSQKKGNRPINWPTNVFPHNTQPSATTSLGGFTISLPFLKHGWKKSRSTGEEGILVLELATDWGWTEFLIALAYDILTPCWPPDWILLEEPWSRQAWVGLAYWASEGLTAPNWLLLLPFKGEPIPGRTCSNKLSSRLPISEDRPALAIGPFECLEESPSNPRALGPGWVSQLPMEGLEDSDLFNWAHAPSDAQSTKRQSNYCKSPNWLVKCWRRLLRDAFGRPWGLCWVVCVSVHRLNPSSTHEDRVELRDQRRSGCFMDC